MNKSREVVRKALKKLREGELTETLLILTDYADTHVRNGKTAEALEEAIRDETHEITAHTDAVERSVLINFEEWEE